MFSLARHWRLDCAVRVTKLTCIYTELNTRRPRRTLRRPLQRRRRRRMLLRNQQVNFWRPWSSSLIIVVCAAARSFGQFDEASFSSVSFAQWASLQSVLRSEFFAASQWEVLSLARFEQARLISTLSAAAADARKAEHTHSRSEGFHGSVRSSERLSQLTLKSRPSVLMAATR